MTSERHTSTVHETVIADVRAHTRHALAQAGLRLARSIAQRFGEECVQAQPASGLADPARGTLAAALAFAEQFARDLGPATRPPPASHPLPRLESMVRVPSVAAMLTDLVLLAELLLPVAGRKLEPGAAFTSKTQPYPGWDGTVNCRILEIEAHRKLSGARYGWKMMGGKLVDLLARIP